MSLSADLIKVIGVLRLSVGLILVQLHLGEELGPHDLHVAEHMVDQEHLKILLLYIPAPVLLHGNGAVQNQKLSVFFQLLRVRLRAAFLRGFREKSIQFLLRRPEFFIRPGAGG
jgi:hypothetical protein